MSDTEITYYSSKCKKHEKVGIDLNVIQRRVRGLISENLLRPNERCQVVEADVDKMFANASITENNEDPRTDMFYADTQDFYSASPLDKPVFFRIHTRFAAPLALKACDREKYKVVNKNLVLTLMQ